MTTIRATTANRGQARPAPGAGRAGGWTRIH